MDRYASVVLGPSTIRLAQGLSAVTALPGGVPADPIPGSNSLGTLNDELSVLRSRLESRLSTLRQDASVATLSVERPAASSSAVVSPALGLTVAHPSQAATTNGLDRARPVGSELLPAAKSQDVQADPAFVQHELAHKKRKLNGDGRKQKKSAAIIHDSDEDSDVSLSMATAAAAPKKSQTQLLKKTGKGKREGSTGGIAVKLKLGGNKRPVCEDFLLPPILTALALGTPSRPDLLPLSRGPTSQSQVIEDFSKARTTNQVPFTTFSPWVEQYLRTFGEDDLAFLAVKSEDLAPFVIPKVGRHYLDSWAEADILALIASELADDPPPMPPTDGPSPLLYGQIQRTRPSELDNETLPTEEACLGPLTERLVSALGARFVSSPCSGETRHSPASSTSHLPAGPPGERIDIDAAEMEEQVKRELRYLGILPDPSSHDHPGRLGPLDLGKSLNESSSARKETEIDWGSREDDEISTALRACQRLLRDQMAINEARRECLSDAVRERMAFQDYEAMRDGLEKTVETGWIKRQRTTKRKVAKNKYYKPNTVIESGLPPLSEDLVVALDNRRRFVEGLAPIFADEPGRQGRFRGLPRESVFRNNLLATIPPSDRSALEQLPSAPAG
ncbi:uncharacterized protein L969DRAFT_89448 [Mixia osmundae IAM 14324]|uniref:Uncharacterized protein n=1 Tax=Mixia osmundae (strain CBS 9802 / IAM 14324 / JCM 22182 / KY 12970) TaxID=764103 RepID=G7DS89_MIXOS|nr:uncharacterized protein L969DRAFT_89448 [Mixia osmundae IAM 14324]KEI37498.1 hypothetical protein L969DRAFT_89448 [Mixia osmundae IAM 14324]GAA93449.1 hypothetical protein E5Q_00090 [Mixia osmundae IAM 14324]